MLWNKMVHLSVKGYRYKMYQDFITKSFSLYFFYRLELWDGSRVKLHCEKQYTPFLAQRTQKHNFSKSKCDSNISSLIVSHFPNMLSADKHWDNFWYKARFWRILWTIKKVIMLWLVQSYFHYFLLCKISDIIFLLNRNFD